MLRRVSLLIVAVALVLPAGAHAATTYTVDPAAAAGCSADNVCKTILDANAKVADGDTVAIKDGAYNETGPIVVTKNGVTFKGTPGKVIVTQTDKKTDTPVFNLGNDATLDGLVIGVQPGGAQAVVSSVGSAAIKNSTLSRSQQTATEAPVIASTAPGGVLTLQLSVVIQGPPGSTTSPAVTGSKGSSLAILGSTIISTTGDGVVISGKDAGTRNSITDSQILTTRSDGDALVVASAADQPVSQETVIDSSILSPGPDGSGIAASSAADGTAKGGPVTVSGTHVTIAGGAAPVTVSAGAQQILLNGGVAGPVEVTLDRSIVHGKSASTSHTETAGVLGVLPIGPTSVAKVAITNSDATDTSHAGVSETGNVNTPDASLFIDAVKRNYRLRIGSPAIDKAGPIVGGESQVDVDLQPRLTGPATDLGADEFLNLPPIAVFTTSATTVRTGQVVQFDASKSVDLEGAGIKTYVWGFGDGKFATTMTPTTEHTYDTPGTYTPRLAAVDAQDNVSAPFSGAAITVVDGVGPAVLITTPKNGAKLHVFKTRKTKTKTTKTRQLFTFRGTAKDDNGIASVAMSLRRVSLASLTTTRAEANSCVYLDGKTKFVTKNCKTPQYFFVHADADGFWAYKTKAAAVFRAGVYELTVVAKDKGGAFSTPVTIRFTLL